MNRILDPARIELLKKKYSEAKEIFDLLSGSRTLSGDFEDAFWKYRGQTILFTEIANKSERNKTKTQMSKVANILARCYMIYSIESNISGAVAVGRINSFRWLAKTIKDNDHVWGCLTGAVFDKAFYLEDSEYTDTTLYHRATSISSFIEFINLLRLDDESAGSRFTSRIVRWTQKLKNPIRSSLQLTSGSFDARSTKLYDADLHIALASARSAVRLNPDFEPRPGYDLIRLESLSFALALGLRIGEICSLPKNALERDTGLYFVRVATEKGSLGGAMPVANLWAPALEEAHEYLLKSCSQARQRAKDIEENGFDFITKALVANRVKNPLSESRLEMLKAVGLFPWENYFINELTHCFEISSKELVSEGKNGAALLKLPRLTASRLVNWIDERMNNWDWANFSKYQKNHDTQHISVYDIGRFCGASKSSITKSVWFISDLKSLLSLIENSNGFSTSATPSPEKILHWRNRWLKIREKALTPRGGGAGASCAVVSIAKLIELLQARYSSYLTRHFYEQFENNSDAITDSSDQHFVATNLRPGQTSKLSNHLIVVWENHFSDNREHGIIPRPILRSDYYHYLSTNSEKVTVFERLNITSPTGGAISITPHQIRRWVTTALLRSGPSETALDLWMGRKPGQSRQYDYRTAKERAEYVRSKYFNTTTIPQDALGKKVVKWMEKGLPTAEIEYLVTDALKVLNFTPWGGCSRELYLSPCTKGLMCLKNFGTEDACQSFHIDTTDEEAKHAIYSLRKQYTNMLEIIYPNYISISDHIVAELNSSEPLDQHLISMAAIITGCDNALNLYELPALEEDRYESKK